MGYEREVLRILPERILQVLDKRLKDLKVEEIRIKIGKPLILISYKAEEVLDYIATTEDIKFIMVKISNYSIYAFEEEMKLGYITMRGGHRVGLAGQCVMEKGEIKTIKNISSINIRLCKEIIGASNKIMRYLVKDDRVLNTLIISPPKCGKTTILRDITRNISNGMYNLDLKGKKVTVIDERSEIAACYNGVPQMNIGIRTDVLDNCLKKSGMIMAIRSLAPDVIVCDEVGTEGDLESLNMAYNSGVNIIVTVHGFDLKDVYGRRVFKRLIDEGIIERIIVLSSRSGAGTIEKIYRVKGGGEFQCLNM